MKHIKLKIYTKLAIFITLIAALFVTVAGCEAYGYPTPTPVLPRVEQAPPAKVINTRDSALLAVYQHLLEQAKSYSAKRYLADFYTTCDNWSAESEYFKDGSGVWYVLVDMSSVEPWSARAYWQQASWFVFKDGSVVPSNRLETNALRIEADLQELSLKL